ncbi:GNAT family N-acetyltransferase [Streptomyces sp. H27-D2]|uniref:GNAT family N-acetyltransferase n=1 Tax=Streptomyces sp. H27-D2 TaxID=3046304 RepID=UPI002DBE8478|nr:GNAT family N-acetyltransferase [Streptomyces sp. H27-D2]MEC4019278.1 GNAT family N-acetyltransferase [Streptomyces sp. H27-D2]
MRIRLSRPEELPALQDIERAAGTLFHAVGMSEIADDEPPALDVLDGYRRAGRAWVAVEPGSDGFGDGGPDGRVIAYLLTDVVDGCAHIEQLSVHPDSAHRGVGRALLDHAAALARPDGLAALTLTTFTDVPWNAPYYTRIGFRPLPDSELTPGLRDIREREAAHGLDRWPRVCMRRDL